MDMAGKDIEVWQMRLVNPQGQKVAFLGKTVDDVIAEATKIITTKVETQEES
jgi:16S rRNA G527 N7-methylase RsmG